MEHASASEGDTLASPIGRASGGDEPDGARWQRLLAEAIRDPQELWRVLDLPPAALPAARSSAKLFPLLIPRGFAALMQVGNLNDPLLRQVVPLAEESQAHPGFVRDPLRESGAGHAVGLLQKYQGRALLVTTGACAVHCRYCFRRHFPYADLPRGRRWWSDAMAALAADPTVSELILSGGDPLTLPDSQLAALADDASAIPHLRRLRIHSRLPVVLPERVDRAFLSWLGASRLRPVVVIHANHANEISDDVTAACRRMLEAGAVVLNQSVLLAGINDRVDALAALSEALFRAGVLPYYLHALDRVEGAGHFQIEEGTAAGLVREMAARLPGYLVPKLVREVPGAASKVPIPW
ncbi:MAG: EF-P beta-lysylation protein EpmB [Planctomycetes bacterium]|nr:EF-P beta-lysylation protein EpmB [Planctomycetota bacterium]